MRVVAIILLGIGIATISYVRTDSVLMIVSKLSIIALLGIFIVVLLLRISRSDRT